jgi:hypothetical protein
MGESDLSTHEMEQDFFRGAQPVKVEVELLAETLEKARQVFAANGWDEAEGLRIALATGIGKLNVDQTLPDEDLASPDTLQGLSDRMMQLESLYAVMKYRAFHLMKDNQILEIQNNALRNTIRALEGTMQRLHDENLELKDRLGEATWRPVPGMVARAPTMLSEVVAAPARQGFLQRICRRLGLRKKA